MGETNLMVVLGFIAIFAVIFSLLTITGIIPLSLMAGVGTTDIATGELVNAEIADLRASGASLGSESNIYVIIKNSGTGVADFIVEFEVVKDNRVYFGKIEKVRNIQRGKQITLTEGWLPSQAGTYNITVKVKNENAIAVYDAKTIKLEIK